MTFVDSPNAGGLVGLAPVRYINKRPHCPHSEKCIHFFRQHREKQTKMQHINKIIKLDLNKGQLNGDNMLHTVHVLLCTYQHLPRFLNFTVTNELRGIQLI